MEKPYTKEWFAEQFARTGTKQAQLYKTYKAEFGIGDRSVVNKMVNGLRNPQPNELHVLLKFFGLRIGESGSLEIVKRAPDDIVPSDPNVTPLAIAISPDVKIGQSSDFPNFGPRDVPAIQNANGGDDGDFVFDTQVMDYFRRPPGLMGQRVFGAYITGDSMYPRFKPGEPVYAYVARPPSPGDDVILELIAREVDGQRRGYIKELVRKSAKGWICRQFNPPKELEFSAAEVRKVYRVVPPNELFG